MDGFVFARVVHVLGVVLWIGGVAMVTTVIFPAVRRMKSGEESIDMFEKLEMRFALQAKVATVLTGASGFYMMYYLDAWERYANPSFWWVHAMTIVWLLFTVVLFVVEPLVLHPLYKKYGAKNPTKTLALAHRFHIFMLAISLLTIAGAVAGTHGFLF